MGSTIPFQFSRICYCFAPSVRKFKSAFFNSGPWSLIDCVRPIRIQDLIYALAKLAALCIMLQCCWFVKVQYDAGVVLPNRRDFYLLQLVPSPARKCSSGDRLKSIPNNRIKAADWIKSWTHEIPFHAPPSPRNDKD